MVYNNYRKYEGQWKQDWWHFRGYERHPNGNTYLGEFMNGKANGHG